MLFTYTFLNWDLYGPVGEQWRLTKHNQDDHMALFVVETKEGTRNTKCPIILQLWKPDPAVATSWLWNVTLRLMVLYPIKLCSAFVLSLTCSRGLLTSHLKWTISFPPSLLSWIQFSQILLTMCERMSSTVRFMAHGSWSRAEACFESWTCFSSL